MEMTTEQLAEHLDRSIERGGHATRPYDSFGRFLVDHNWDHRFHQNELTHRHIDESSVETEFVELKSPNA